MKKLMLFLLVLVLLPATVFAADSKYESKNLKEVLADEEIEEAFKSYKETDDQVIIYLFRGEGCGFCRRFLQFLNDITDEYGKKFKLVSYEVWYNEENNNLMNEVGTFLNNVPQGVPYIIIGDKVFAGFAESYEEPIKEKIDEMYKTKKKDRYDVMEELEKSKKGKEKASTTSSKSVIFWNLGFVAAGVVVIILFVNKKINTLEENITKAAKKSNKAK